MSHASDPWSQLGLPRDASVRDVKRRYAQLLKLHRPDDDAETFEQLRRLYEICLAQAKRIEQAMQAVVEIDIASGASAAAQEVAAALPAPESLSAPEAPPAEPAPASAPEPLRELPPAVVVEVSLASLRLERLATLRKPSVVIDDLLAHAGSTPEAFRDWLGACPEIANFEARDAVEIELIARMASGTLTLPVFALNALDARFGWSHYDTPRRLAAAGLSRTMLEHVLPALEKALVEARFIAHVDSNASLYKPGSGKAWNGTLGNAARENALLRELHAARGKKPRWWQALRPSRIANVNNLLYAYAAHNGHAAADQLFGARAVRYWQRLLPNAPANLSRLWLQVMRGVIGIAAAMTVIGALMYADNSASKPPLREFLTLTVSMMCVWSGMLLSVFAIRWTRETGAGKLRILRLRMLDALQRFLQPSVALPALVAWNVPAIWLGITQSRPLIAGAGIVAVGVFIGGLPMIGALVLAGLGGAVLADIPGIAPWQLAAFAANVPTLAWLIDRAAVRWTDWQRTRSGKRDAVTLTALVMIAIAIAFALGR